MKNQLLPQVVHIPLCSLTYPSERKPKRLSLEYTSHVQELSSRGSQKTTPNKLERTSRIAGTLTIKLSLGAKIVKVGGVGRIFKYNLSLVEGEKMLKASQCYLSTTAGRIAGILFISTEKVAFCSEKSIELSSPTGKVIRIPYKVSIPMEKMLRANERKNLRRLTRKYIEIVTQDNFDFWYLQQVITQTQRSCHTD